MTIEYTPIDDAPLADKIRLNAVYIVRRREADAGKDGAWEEWRDDAPKADAPVSFYPRIGLAPSVIC